MFFFCFVSIHKTRNLNLEQIPHHQATQAAGLVFVQKLRFQDLWRPKTGLKNYNSQRWMWHIRCSWGMRGFDKGPGENESWGMHMSHHISSFFISFHWSSSLALEDWDVWQTQENVLQFCLFTLPFERHGPLPRYQVVKACLRSWRWQQWRCQKGGWGECQSAIAGRYVLKLWYWLM